MFDTRTRTRDWVVVADEGRAKFFAPPSDGAPLDEIEQLTFESARASEADLRRDAHGRRAGGDPRSPGGSITASAGAAPLELEAERFSNRIAEYLAAAERAGRFERLYLIAAPRLLGRLRGCITPAVRQRIAGDADKDLAALDARALTQRLFPAVDVRGPVR